MLLMFNVLSEKNNFQTKKKNKWWNLKNQLHSPEDDGKLDIKNISSNILFSSYFICTYVRFISIFL